MFTLWNLIEASLLCLNAVCILHEERFLAKFGFGTTSTSNHPNNSFGEAPTMKSQVLNLIRSIRMVVKYPLIILNIITILFKMIMG